MGTRSVIRSRNWSRVSCCSASDRASSGRGVDLDHDAIRPDRDAAKGERLDQPALAGGVARIDDHRQVGQVVEQRDGGKVHRVARVRLERPDPALAQDDVRVPGADDVLGGHQELLDGRAVAAFEHDRSCDPAHLPEQRVVLHVPGPDLEDVRVLGDDVDLGRLHDLGDDRQPGPLARLGEIAQPLDAEALEGVRARPWLERAAAQDRGAGGLDRVGGLEQHVAVLDRARPGHHRERAVADDRVEHPDHRVLGPELPRRQLERAADRGDPLDARQGRQPIDQHRLASADLPDHGDHRSLVADMIEGRQPLGQDLALDSEDLGLTGADGHHDEHRGAVSSSVGQTKKQRCDLCFVCPARPVPPVLATGNVHAGHRK